MQDRFPAGNSQGQTSFTLGVVDMTQAVFDIPRHLRQIKDCQSQGTRDDRKTILKLDNEDQITKEPNYY